MDCPLIRARWYTPANRTEIRYLVLHSMESEERDNTAESVARYFQTTDRKSSVHLNFDNNSCVRSVLDKDVAYGAAGANQYGIHFEHAGRARQSTAEWLDPYGTAMLKLSAAHAKETCDRWKIPIAYVNAAGLRAGQRGITTHYEVNQAWPSSGHWDPGPGFPISLYIKWANQQREEKDLDADQDRKLSEIHQAMRATVQPFVDELKAGEWIVKPLAEEMRRLAPTIGEDAIVAAVKRAFREGTS